MTVDRIDREWLRGIGKQLADAVVDAAPRTSSDLTVMRYGTNPHTSLDREVDNRLREALVRIVPAPVLSEEHRPARVRDDDLCWVVDPIDGTLNAWAGSADFAVSVALVDQRESADRAGPSTLAAAVSVPREDVLFEAIRGGGATRNGIELDVKSLRPGNSGPQIVAFGIPHDMSQVADRMAGTMHRLMHAGWTTRQTGAATIDICRVASGLWRGFFEYQLQYWDFAAAALVAEEAGCKVYATPVNAARTGGLPLVYDLVVARTAHTGETLLKTMDAAAMEEDAAAIPR
jgi:myo-inositol-1(or 4)-monophosphatase